MSFASALPQKISLYTEFTIFGKLIQLPYKMGGKKTPTEISAVIGKNVTPDASQQTIQNWVTGHSDDVGVDCSGFAYFVLNEASGGTVMKAFGNTSYANGVSAATLTSTNNGSQVTKANDITPGCLMRTDNGGHVIVIYSVSKGSNGKVNRIDYAHSNGSKGPHKGYIIIGNSDEDLASGNQTWYDSAYTDSQAKGYYNKTMKLNCL